MKNCKHLVKTILNFLLVTILLPTLMIAQDQGPKKIIYDTDMCLDVDDVGALALLHALQNTGESELLAVVFNEVHSSGAPAIDAINTWYGRGDIPIGIYKGQFYKPDTSPYLASVTKFPHDLETADAPSALDVYRKTLSEQEDGSVTIVSVGFLNNLNDLLIAEPQLVAKKVKELVIMAGLNNDGFNLTRHDLVDISQNVIENWPTPLVISHNGGSIKSGEVLKNAPEANPVRMGFYKYFDDSFEGRSSWDELAVLYGVRGLWTVFEEITEGTGSLPNDYVWKMKPGYRSHLEHKISDDAFVKIIDDLMMMPPLAKKVIYDTDMCADVDDVGALAMLHAMADNNEAEILAVCFNEVHPFGAPAIDAINTWYGRGDIPIGIYKDSIENPHDSRYLERVAQFPHDLETADAPSTLEVYQKVLNEQADGSVTIISVGFVNNLAKLLRNDPQLIATKVKELVLMAGTTDGGGFNMNQHNLSSVSEYVIREWPTPIVFTDPGGKIFTGPGLKDSPVENPVREAYYKYFKNDFKDRPSWDQITVLYGVRGLADYFSMGTTGKGHLMNGFEYKIEAGHRTFVIPLITDNAYARIIEDLMMKPPLRARNQQLKKVIYDTDMCQDVDDVGALALLHALENYGESKLLAVVFNELHQSGAPAIDAINTWYGRGDIPIGIYKGDLINPQSSRYLEHVAKFPHDLKASDAPSALDVYRKTLREQPDGSVTIISVGFVNNLSDLLNAEPQLVSKKVKELVVMAGLNNDGFNLGHGKHNLSEASQNVIENWPTPLIISSLGGGVHSGVPLKDAPEANPVREGFYKYFKDSFKGRSSWDELAVLYGVRGVGTIFEIKNEGSGSLRNGYVWDMKPGYRMYLDQKIPDSSFVKIVDDLMMVPPKN